MFLRRTVPFLSLVPAVSSAVQVVEKITAYPEKHPEASDLIAYEAVREALVRSFPCDR